MRSAHVNFKVIPLLALGLIGLLGCGESTSTSSTDTTTEASVTTTEAPTSTAPSTAAPKPTVPPTTEAPATTTPPTAAPELSKAPRAGDEYFFNESGSSYAAFKSPSGNVTCDLTDKSAECVVVDNTWVMPPRGDCDLMWGGAVHVWDRQAGHTCRGDATNAATKGPVLPYGSEIEHGPFLCLSEDTGVTCDNQDTGHGFKVNRASFDLY